MVEPFKAWITKAFNWSILDRKRYIWVDYLRGIAIILVVYHHTFLGMQDDGGHVPRSVVDANLAAYSFRMPLFFIFSGLFTGLSLKSKSVRKIVWDKFNILFYPYVIWASIQISLQILLSNYTKSNASFTDYTYILYQPKQLAQFWYLPALFNATMVFVLLKEKVKIPTTPHLLLGVVFFLLAPFFNSISMLSNWMRLYVFLAIGDSIGFFMLSKATQNQLRKSRYFLFSIPLFLMSQIYYLKVIGARPLENDSANFEINLAGYTLNQISFLLISLIGCTTFILFSFLLQKWNKFKWLRIVGYHSLYIYILHVMVVSALRMFLKAVFGVSSYIVILPLGIFFGIIVPIVFYNLIGKNYLWFLFSTSKKASQKDKELKQPKAAELSR